ncbi:MAG TPA: glutamine synthetase family protein, partial [Gemmatimonadales bacterium]|nr:glutamine synthetase family protein [Gemmatimonadales bacterium]
SALVLCDTYDREGVAVAEAPRAILRHQVDRLHERGLTAAVATELEFYVFSDSYKEAASGGYSGLTPLYHRHGDHDVLVTGFLDRFLAPVRQAMAQMSIPALSTLGEGGVGQAEVNFGHGDPLTTADHHVLFKHTTKALAEQHGVAATFMAKIDEANPGSGCHLHLSLWDAGSSAPVTATGTDSIQLSERARSFLAGVLAYSGDLTVLHAPYANSYRRLQPGSWAPTGATWGYDNRTVLARVLGSGISLRLEFRLPGADVNPYISIAALLAAGIAGLDERANLTTPSLGDASAALDPTSGVAALPHDLGQAAQVFASSPLARKAFGSQVHSHLAARAQAEWAAATRPVTDWDRRHGFEGA